MGSEMCIRDSVWHVFLYFGMIGVWAGIAYLAARNYHKKAPGSLQFEMDQYLNGTDKSLDQHYYDGEDKSLKNYLVLVLIMSIFAAVSFALRKF